MRFACVQRVLARGTKVAIGVAFSVQMMELKMARSRREQQVELQKAIHSSSGASLSETQSVRNGANARSFSTDPSPFSRRPTLSKESSAYRELVALAAYYRAERRGFAPGGEVEDWIEAEREVAAHLGAP